MELWRGVWALPTQLLLFPTVFALRGDVADQTFRYVFALYMLLDLFLAGHLDFIFYVHHAACVLGHAIEHAHPRIAFALSLNREQVSEAIADCKYQDEFVSTGTAAP